MAFEEGKIMNKEKIVNLAAGELTDEELLEVNGGAIKFQLMRVACVHCGRHFNVNIKKSKAKCPHCKEFNEFAG